ncbi:hypothetical protein T4B_14742 [Trichinella pseudospiralis]|uniref:Secreted protein n=1 Tax=Trichinella pseudospiralis TaxID=6337 RepID=A0A0V1GKJ7_TRIPS|nr:hypothetical protein T4B_6246 [Trichinella pseudospiralis]KRY98354.1 hypothetical protein T4B_15085 [Trichinella pseudospiralis]KRY98843.1 hypothetical protein T4B_11841 [Trichinella pseudospiralis]KRY98845.1 hypothetical protein T4B_14742 [Trichinella pseudospiralis]KRZ00358.1 hypothetical protein T4C_4355 [Trichinella pseudospiralis]
MFCNTRRCFLITILPAFCQPIEMQFILWDPSSSQCLWPSSFNYNCKRQLECNRWNIFPPKSETLFYVRSCFPRDFVRASP